MLNYHSHFQFEYYSIKPDTLEITSPSMGSGIIPQKLVWSMGFKGSTFTIVSC